MENKKWQVVFYSKILDGSKREIVKSFDTEEEATKFCNDRNSVLGCKVYYVEENNEYY